MRRRLWRQYFEAIEQTVDALAIAYVEQFEPVVLTSTRANLKLRVRFYNKYLLSVGEALLLVDTTISKIDYRYHFQNEDNNLIFRYDSTPHFPSISSFPHHKHLPNDVVATHQPDIFEVFREVSDFLDVEK